MTLALREGVMELALHHEPCNEIGEATLVDLERLVAILQDPPAPCLILYSTLPRGFSAGADLRALYDGMQSITLDQRVARVRQFLERIHAAFNALDGAPLTTIAAVHGVVFGGGLELALTADLIIADRMTRFCFPELRLGLIPGFGGIPRLRRDIGNALVRDMLLTGRSVGAARACEAGLVSQLAARGAALTVARRTAEQVLKFDAATAAVAKQFIKPIPHDALAREIDLFCALVGRPAVDAGLRRFVADGSAHPYLP